MTPSDDIYQRQIRSAFSKVTADAAAGDLDSRLLNERLSLEQTRQDRLSSIQDYSAQNGYPDTLRGRTEAMNVMDQDEVWAEAGRNFGLSGHDLFVIRNRLPFSQGWRAEEVRLWVEKRVS